MTGHIVRITLKWATSWSRPETRYMWAVRAADLPGLEGQYYRYMTDGRQRYYGTMDQSQASVWKYRATAESFLVRYGISGDVIEVPVCGTGEVTNDGRPFLRPGRVTDATSGTSLLMLD